MSETGRTSARKSRQSKSRMPEDSLFYDKIVPAMLIGLGIVMLILIIIAAGILLGFIPYQ